MSALEELARGTEVIAEWKKLATEATAAYLEQAAALLLLGLVILLVACVSISPTGNLVTSGRHSVNLSWIGSTSSNISGYNIYRAVYSPAPVNACGSFAKINPSLNGSTEYTDSDVTDGTAYCYAITAVDMSNEESGYSNIISDVQIPPL